VITFKDMISFLFFFFLNVMSVYVVQVFPAFVGEKNPLKETCCFFWGCNNISCHNISQYKN